MSVLTFLLAGLTAPGGAANPGGAAPLPGTAAYEITKGAAAACGTGLASACNQTSLALTFGKIANTLTILVGAVSVIMIIIGGLRYVISQGDSKAVTDAKNTIMYAVIGVLVAIVAFAIVQFVINTIGK